jgi:hypothetical protein
MLRIVKNPVRGVALVATATAVATCTVSASAAAVDDQGEEHTHCVVHDNLTELAEVHVAPAGPGGPVSAAGTSVGEFRTSTGSLVGTEDGTFVAYLRADSTRWELFQYTAELPEGSVFGGGTVSIDAITAGQEATLYAVGTSGRLRGLTGTWSFRLTGAPAPFQTLFTASFTLCR